MMPGQVNSSEQVSAAYRVGDDIDLRAFVLFFWRGKWIIGGVAFAVTVIAIIVALMMPNVYRAEALLAPSQQERAGGLSALAAQYGGLASLAGLSLPQGSLDKTEIALAVLRSRQFIGSFIDRHDLLVPLMAAVAWDRESGDLLIDQSLYDTQVERWVRDVSPPRQTIPSSQEAYKAFSDLLLAELDNKTGLVIIGVEHLSPSVAKQWVDWLVDDINAAVMRQDVQKAEQAIQYLKQQIELTSLAELKNVFFHLIEEQMKTVMLAKASPEYMFRTLDPAIAPELKAKPKRAVIAVLGLVIGVFLGIAVHIVSASLGTRGVNAGG